MATIDFEKLDKIQVNFIVGPGRSGTTLLVYLFNEHKNCVAIPEIKHVVYFYKKYKDVTHASKELIEDYNNYFSLFRDNKKFILSTENENNWINKLVPGEPITYDRLSKLAYLSLIDGKDNLDEIKFIIDKNPYYSFHLDIINEVFPNSKILTLQRDCRAFVLSNRQSQKPIMRILSVSYYALVWNLFARKLKEFGQIIGTRMQTLSYEELVTNKEKHVQSICEFFGIPFDLTMFQFHENVAKKIEAKNYPVALYERAKKKLLDLSAPINTNRVYAWKTQLSKKEIKKIDFLSKSYLDFYGFSADNNRFNLIEKIQFSITSFIARFRLTLFQILDSPKLNHRIYQMGINKKIDTLIKKVMLSGTKKDIHFIIGIGRSGTTLLSQLLNNHKEIQALPEANFLVFFLNQFQNKKQFTINDINLLFEQIDVYSRSHPWVGWNFDLEKTKNKIYDTLKANPQVSYREICFQIYNQFIPNCSDDKSTSSILLDKNPSYTLYSDKLKNFLPDSKFILLIRDYRSNVLSRKQSVYFKSPNVAFNAMRWKLFNQKAFKFLNSHPDDFITLRYEDLVEDNQKAQFKVFDFFKIEHKIYPDLKTINKVTAEEFKISDKFKERFYKKYGDLKKRGFHQSDRSLEGAIVKKEISICEAICGEYGENFGYIQTTFMSPKQKFILKLKYLFPILLAHVNIQKDMILYKISPKWKLKRLKKEYKKLGFID